MLLRVDKGEPLFPATQLIVVVATFVALDVMALTPYHPYPKTLTYGEFTFEQRSPARELSVSEPEGGASDGSQQCKITEDGVAQHADKPHI
jgi:hypothetical protein